MIQDIKPHTYTVSYKVSKPHSNDCMLIYSHNGLLCKSNNEFPVLTDLSAANPGICDKAIYLFTIDNCDFYTVIGSEVKSDGNFTYVQRHNLRFIRPFWYCFAAMLGLHLHTWYSANVFCGRCGVKNEIYKAERAVRCPDCGKITYPQICPSVIVGIIDGDKILLTKYAPSHSRHKNYALVAGYNDVGESLEDTVRREVMEEVGLKVKNITYYSSQPWPLTCSLLIGYFCELDGDSSIKLDCNELSCAEWLTADEIPADSADPTISLTGTMIYEFKKGYRL